MADPALSIVIPTWNRRELVCACLDSIAKQGIEDVEIIVVDDGGTDDTGDVLARDYSGVRVIRRDANGGFAKAVNAGIAAAMAPRIFLLNNDITLEANCISLLMDFLDTHEDVAIAGPLMMMADRPGWVYAAGDRQRRNGTPEPIGYRIPMEEVDFKEHPFGISAGAAVYRRRVFDTIGRFDERFIAYFEDADLNFRARLAGFDCALVRDAVVMHRGAASIDNRMWWRTRQCFRNHALLVLKNMPGPLLLRHAPAIALERVRGISRVFSAARCHGGMVFAVAALAKVTLELIALLPYLMAARRQVQALRRVAPSHIEARLRR